MVKKVLFIIEVKDVEVVKVVLLVVYKEFDKVVSKGILKKNIVFRKKVRLVVKVNFLVSFF